MSVTVTGYPSTTSFTFNTDATLESSKIVSYVVVDQLDFVGDEYIEVTYNSETVTIYIQEECRYTPIDIHFINKQGAQQVLTFYKAKEESIKITSEDYESDRGQPLAGFHQFINYNINARESFKVNSGFVYEEQNDDFKQLLLSSRVWMYKDDIYTPLNLSTSSLTFKNRQKDRLIKYEIEFDYSFNEINNV